MKIEKKKFSIFIFPLNNEFFLSHFHFKNTSHDFIMYASRFKTIHYCCLKGFFQDIYRDKKKTAHVQVGIKV